MVMVSYIGHCELLKDKEESFYLNLQAEFGTKWELRILLNEKI